MVDDAKDSDLPGADFAPTEFRRLPEGESFGGDEGDEAFHNGQSEVIKKSASDLDEDGQQESQPPQLSSDTVPPSLEGSTGVEEIERNMKKEEEEEDRNGEEEGGREREREGEECDVSGDGESCASTLYVQNLPSSMTAEELRSKFSEFGGIAECRIVINPVSKESRGFGFVSFHLREEADRAQEAMNQQRVDGKVLKVEKARRAKPHDPTPGQYKGPSAWPRSSGASVKYDIRGRLKPGYVPFWDLPPPKGGGPDLYVRYHDDRRRYVGRSGSPMGYSSVSRYRSSGRLGDPRHRAESPPGRFMYDCDRQDRYPPFEEPPFFDDRRRAAYRMDPYRYDYASYRYPSSSSRRGAYERQPYDLHSVRRREPYSSSRDLRGLPPMRGVRRGSSMERNSRPRSRSRFREPRGPRLDARDRNRAAGDELKSHGRRE